MRTHKLGTLSCHIHTEQPQHGSCKDMEQLSTGAVPALLIREPLGLKDEMGHLKVTSTMPSMSELTPCPIQSTNTIKGLFQDAKSGWASSNAVKLLGKMLMSHFTVPGFSSWLLLLTAASPKCRHQEAADLTPL